MEKTEVLDSIRQVVCDLDATTTHLVQARLNHDDEAERKALFEMEGMIVAAQQELTFLYDYIYNNLALTWEDIRFIVQTFHKVVSDVENISSEEAYQETLKRFNEYKNDKD